MSDTIIVRGFAGTTPEMRITDSGLNVTTFRLGSTPRWRNRDTGEWNSGNTNWYTVTCFQKLAENVVKSVVKGDPVVVTGRPRIRTWESDQGTKGMEDEISAQGLGHDLTFGTASFQKSSVANPGSSGTSSAALESDTGVDASTAGAPADSSQEAPTTPHNRSGWSTSGTQNTTAEQESGWDSEVRKNEPAF